MHAVEGTFPIVSNAVPVVNVLIVIPRDRGAVLGIDSDGLTVRQRPVSPAVVSVVHVIAKYFSTLHIAGELATAAWVSEAVGGGTRLVGCESHTAIEEALARTIDS